MQITMKECTGTDKPLVSIAMAVYNPRPDWLREQLVSLNDQSYENLELLILDDCSPDVPYDEIKACAEDCITKFPYTIARNHENQGSTKAFENLTKDAAGQYIAYCDQDDLWDSRKIETLLNYFVNGDTALVYSDVQVIDGCGRQVAGSITKFRPRHVLFEGAGLAAKLLVQNFVIGCTMMIKADLAKSMIPFDPGMVHDHYLALMASLGSNLRLCGTPLVFYRIHGKNQTGTLCGVNNKDDYLRIKIRGFYDRMHRLKEKPELTRIKEFNELMKWAEARNAYGAGSLSAAKDIWKYRHFDLNLSIFEILMLRMPGTIFKTILKFIKEGNH